MNPPADRLDGWKEIASYLGRAVKTAQRWEKLSGLPVHRLPGVRGPGSVYAFREELDAWMMGEHHADAAGASATARSPSRRRRIRVAAALLSAVLLVVLLAALWPTREGDLAAVAFLDGRRLAAYDSEGHELWRRVFPEGIAVGEDDRPVALPLDLDGDGALEVLLAHRSEGRVRDRVQAFSAAGETIWDYPVGRTIRLDGTGYRDSFGLWQIFPVRQRDGSLRIAVLAHHKPWFPTLVDWLDPATGERVGSYVHGGYLFAGTALDLDADGGEELVLGGYNNILESPVVLALRAGEGLLLSPGIDTADGPAEHGREFAYLRLERSLAAEARAKASWVRHIALHDDLIRVDVFLEADRGSPEVASQEVEERIYLFTPRLEIARVDPTRNFQSFLAQLRDADLLTHGLDEELARFERVEWLVDNRTPADTASSSTASDPRSASRR